MNRHEAVVQFCQLFDGCRDAVGTEEGGCDRLADPEDWEMYLEGHLRGVNPPIGVYPMTTMIDNDWTTVGSDRDGPKTWVVKWGCVDFDEGDEESWLYARDVCQVLDQFGITSWIERSRSKGYHVWVFLEDWTDADTVRRGLLAACQIVSAPTKEINPKQSTLADGQLGNYVRLPYPAALTGPIYPPPNEDLHRRVMLSPGDGEPHSLSWFLDVAAQTLTRQQELEELAWYYIAPAQRTPVQRDWARLEGDAVERLKGKARIIWEQGPLEHPDSDTGFRGHTLWKLSRYVAEDGKHTPEEALELIRDADARWGKFHERPDGEQRLQEMIDKAFNV